MGYFLDTFVSYETFSHKTKLNSYVSVVKLVQNVAETIKCAFFCCKSATKATLVPKNRSTAPSTNANQR